MWAAGGAGKPWRASSVSGKLNPETSAQHHVPWETQAVEKGNKVNWHPQSNLWPNSQTVPLLIGPVLFSGPFQMRDFWTAYSHLKKEKKKVFFQPAFLSAGCVMVNSVAFYEWLPLLVVNAGMDHICPLILGVFFLLWRFYILKVFLMEINYIHSTLVSLMILFSKSHFISYLCVCKIYIFS